jgi:hypothetical protein
MIKKIMVLLVLMVCFINQCFAFNGPLKKHPTKPHWFTDNSGKGIYLSGCWTWNNVQDYESTLDFNSYLNFLEANGQNYTKFRVWEHIDINPPLFKPAGTNGNAWNGASKFDVTQVNPVYLQRLRDRIIAAGKKGIYCQISLFQWREEPSVVRTTNGVFYFTRNALHSQNNINGINGDTNRDGNGSEIQIETNSATTKIQKGYLRQIIDYLNDLDNIFYEVAIEGPTTGLAWRNEMINYIHSYESTKPKQHLVNISPTGIAYSYDLSYAQMEFMLSGPADIVSPSLLMGYDSDPPSNTRKILLNDDDHYWWQDAGGVPSWVGPQWVWKNFLRGVHTTLLDTLPKNVIGGFTNAANPTYKLHGGDTAIYVAMRKNMGYAINYSKKMNLGNMLPRGDLATSGYCLAGGGEYLALTSPYSNSVTVNLQGTAGTLNVEWFNPSNGQVTSGGTVTGGASRSFSAPFSNAWPYDQCQAVLYLQAQTPSLVGRW